MKRPLRKTSECRIPLSAEAISHAANRRPVRLRLRADSRPDAGRAHRGPAASGTAVCRACSDAELLTIALVRYVLGRRSEAGFLGEVARDWGHLFPHLPRYRHDL